MASPRSPKRTDQRTKVETPVQKPKMSSARGVYLSILDWSRYLAQVVFGVTINTANKTSNVFKSLFNDLPAHNRVVSGSILLLRHYQLRLEQLPVGLSINFIDNGGL